MLRRRQVVMVLAVAAFMVATMVAPAPAMAQATTQIGPPCIVSGSAIDWTCPNGGPGGETYVCQTAGVIGTGTFECRGVVSSITFFPCFHMGPIPVPDQEFFVCEGAPGTAQQQQHTAQQQQQQNQQPVCPPVSQEVGQEARSGEVELSGGVENSGDYATQTAAPLQFGDTGNLQNATGVLQACGSEMGDVESSGISKEISPTLDIESDRSIGQSTASEQGQ